jgi:hypothetical protein
MHVSVRVALREGHVWEFICDDGDPILTGLVSALPGASTDANLPPDGLLQVESRSGERIFVSRQSLVSITIRELGPAGAPNGMLRRGAITPAPFFILPDCMEDNVVAHLSSAAGEAMRSLAATGVKQIQLHTLPTTVSVGLAAAVAEARKVLAPTEELKPDLILKIYLIDVDAQPPPIESNTLDLFSFVLILNDGGYARPSAIVALDDIFLSGRDDNSISEPRIVTLASNSLLAFTFSTQRVPIVLRRTEDCGTAIFVSGSLRAKS